MGSKTLLDQILDSSYLEVLVEWCITYMSVRVFYRGNPNTSHFISISRLRQVVIPTGALGRFQEQTH